MRYRKMPVVVEAVRLEENRESFRKAYEFLGDSVDFSAATNGAFINIKTLEGTMIASAGDYIIKGVNGEFYPCKPGVFEKTYEVEELSEDFKAHLESRKEELLAEFQKKAEVIINEAGVDSLLDMPDFIIAEYLTNILRNNIQCVKKLFDWRKNGTIG